MGNHFRAVLIAACFGAAAPAYAQVRVITGDTEHFYGPGGELPDTVQRSCKEAQELFAEAYASAVQVHGEGDRAYRVAFTVLKQKFEKRGDHWIAKLDATD